MDPKPDRFNHDERLHGYPDLVAWSRHAGALAEPEADALLREAARRLEALAALNAAATRVLGKARLAPAGGRYRWAWGGEGLEVPLWAVARSAAELLTSQELDRVRVCEGHGCDWVFLDASRAGRRRWCSMENCGNRAKARRHYQRERAASA